MKALILAAGNSSRFNQSTPKPVHKCLTPVGSQRVIDFSLDAAIKLQVEEIVIVVGYLAETIIETYGDGYRGVPISYAFQTERQGLVHAIMCGQQALATSDFWLFLGDEVLIGGDHHRMLENFYKEQAFVICGMVPTDNLDLVRKNYSVAFDSASKRISQLVEKPETPFNAFIGTGNCVFKNEIMGHISTMPPDPKTGRKELAGLIQHAIGDGQKVLCHNFETATYVNINTYDDLLRVQQAVAVVKG